MNKANKKVAQVHVMKLINMRKESFKRITTNNFSVN